MYKKEKIIKEAATELLKKESWIIGVLQSTCVIIVILSFFLLIWYPWVSCLKLGLTGVVSFVLLGFIYVLLKKVVRKEIIKYIENNSSDLDF